MRITGTLPPEPKPDLSSILKGSIPNRITEELKTKDNSLVIFITVDETETYRGRSYAWVTHADDDIWTTFWYEENFGTLTDDIEVIRNEAHRRIQQHEKQITSQSRQHQGFA